MPESAQADVWRSLGASASAADELVAYCAGGAVDPRCPVECPLSDEPFVAAWDRYLNDARSVGIEATLRRIFVQLAFPVQAGISRTEPYQRATRRGISTPTTLCAGQAFIEPSRLSVFLHATPAGRIPVIVTGARADFELLVRALTCRNEPEPIPPAVGACVVAGYVNWERVARWRDTWSARQPTPPSDADWTAAFGELARCKDLYQDRLIILSDGPYSAVAATEVGLSDVEWGRASLTLRLHHEATHYFTRRAFHSMRNNLLDELVADYVGIVAARGAYRSEWFLSFMGLERFPAYRQRGRLERYRGTPALGDEAFGVLQHGLVLAARALEEFDRHQPIDVNDQRALAARVTALTRAGLTGLIQDVPDTLLPCQI